MNAVLAALAGCLPLQAGAQLPVVRASSPIVDIQDGHNLRKGYWTVDPAAKLDVYYAQRSTRPKQVTFKTDIDSLSFDVRPGEHCDFLVSLNGKDCPTRISTLRESCRRSGAGEIPLHLGRDGKLHIQGRINDSDELDLLFDIGADTLVLYPSARSKKARLALDGTVMNSGMGGTEQRATSNENRLRIADLAWDHEQVMAIETQSDDADGIVGFNVFEDKIVEFDYGRLLLTIHDTLPAAHDGFTRAELRFQGTLPHVEASVSDGKRSQSGWFAFDTGYNGSVYVARGLVARAPFLDGLERLASNHSGGVGKETIAGAFVLLPELQLGGAALRQVPISIETSPDGAHHQTSLLGMDVLRRYDTLLDFQSNEVWWKPNQALQAPFEKRYGFRAGGALVAALALCLAAGGVLVWKRRRGAA